MSGPAPPVAPTTRSLAPTALPRLLGGGGLLVLGLLFGRPDVVALGVPLVLSAVWSVLRPSSGETTTVLSPLRHVASQARVAADLTLEPAPGVATAHLRISAPDHRDLDVLVAARRRRVLTASFVTARTGRLEGFRTTLVATDLGGVLRREAAPVGPGSVLVLPQASSSSQLPLPPRLQGLTGSHRSSQPGDGGELRDIAVFAPGDRLRRIDWKATARRASNGAGRGGTTDLYVRRTFATSDAHVVLVVDTRDAVGPDVSSWATGRVHPDDATSLDVARRTAAMLARSYLDQGDRVGLVRLGGRGRRVRPAGGRRHLHQLTHHLALSAPDGPPAAVARAPQLPSGALVVVLSTFLDDAAADLTRTWRYAGHRTVAVDVTPAPDPDGLTRRLHAAYRLVELERQGRLAALRAAGVEVVAGAADTSSVTVVLAALARARRVGR